MRTIIYVLIGLAIILPFIALAANLEVGYPQFTDEEGKTVGPGGGPAGWIRYIFFFALGVVGLAAIGSFIYAGIVWMTASSEEKTKDALDRIKGAVIGIVVVVGSVLLLQTINPDLIRLENPTFNKSVFELRPEDEPVVDCANLCAPPLVCDPGVGCRRPVGIECEGINDCTRDSYCRDVLVGASLCTLKKANEVSCTRALGGRDCISGNCKKSGSGFKCAAKDE